MESGVGAFRSLAENRTMKRLALSSLLRRLPPRSRAVLTTCLYGLTAGAATVAFQLGMNCLYQAGLVRLSAQSKVSFLLGS